MLIKKLHIQTGKAVWESSLRIATTMIIGLSLAFLVLVLGTFINDNLQKYSIYEDFYLPDLNNTYPPHNSLPPASELGCNCSTTPLTSKSYCSSARQLRAPDGLLHSMTDEELVWRASMVPRVKEPFYNRTQKVAFMFLTRGRLPLAPLWEMFFKGHEGLLSIYIHTSPDFTYEYPESSVFYKRRIPSKTVQWGQATMIDAERRLLANALLDFSNERFILLSESCIPLYNFTTIYIYLIHANQSFLSAFDDPRPIGRGRYNKRMWPAIAASEWRKGSQWFEANRKLAIEIISDVTLYPVFKNLCHPPCYMDEHYFPTLVTKNCPELTSNRTITWTDWSGGGSHPRTFKRGEVSEALLNHVRNDFNCSYNGEFSSICHLFARKFHPSTLQTLLDLAPKMFGV